MAEYIDRNELLERAKGTQAYFVIKGLLCGIPAANVEPVRHGHWIPSMIIGEAFASHVKCSECDAVWEYEFDCCPHCGAHMDGEVEG